MVGAEDLDDDYVARLLAEDAKKTSQKYLSQGLSAFLPQRRIDAPKPNTRFLSHIVREADSHNAALKRKEEIEAKKRLRELHGQDERPRKRARADETADSKRNRLLKDIVSAASSENKTKYERRDSRQREESRRTTRDHWSKDSQSSRHDERVRDNRSSRHSGRRSRSPESQYEERAGTSDVTSQRRRRERHHSRDEESKDSIKRKTYRGSFDGVNERLSTELEAPIRKRGRGAFKKQSGMDDRFEKSYDPSQDISLDSDREDDSQDWDMALEAMRDRAKWKQNQAARMREAGFDEKYITKWEKSSLEQTDREPDLTDFKWSRKGEIREWDAGKVQE